VPEAPTSYSQDNANRGGGSASDAKVAAAFLGLEQLGFVKHELRDSGSGPLLGTVYVLESLDESLKRAVAEAISQGGLFDYLNTRRALRVGRRCGLVGSGAVGRCGRGRCGRCGRAAVPTHVVGRRWTALIFQPPQRAQSFRQVPMEQAVRDGVAGPLIAAMLPLLEIIFAAGWRVYDGVFVPREGDEDPYHQVLRVGVPACCVRGGGRPRTHQPLLHHSCTHVAHCAGHADRPSQLRRRRHARAVQPGRRAALVQVQAGQGQERQGACFSGMRGGSSAAAASQGNWAAANGALGQMGHWGKWGIGPDP
jgi:hypothetical protein